jgi:seryl-tRNA synthetase
VLRELTARGDLWEPAAGLVGLRGPALHLFHRIEAAVRRLACGETRDEWLVPPGIPLGALARAQYFASFPQWLTLATHLTDDPAALERVASAADPAAAARVASAPADAALLPAVCYHVYAGLAGTTIATPMRITVQATCWRHEGERLAALARNWAFTMREIVCLGTEEEVEAFRERGMRLARGLAETLHLDATIAVASDPFFAPTARGKAMLQRVKALKHELLLPVGAGHTVAAASFNHHERFFGDAFDIRLADGSGAHTGCVAFGLERWLLAVLVRHGPDPDHWPAAAAEPALMEAS